MIPALVAAVLVVPDVEVQAGYLTDSTTSAPAAAIAGGLDIADLVALRLHFTGAFGSPLDHASGASPNLDPSGFRAWRLLLEARLHTAGELQFHVSAGAGVARLADWQCNCNESEWLHGKTAFSARGAAGMRAFVAGGLTVSAEFEVSRWSGLQHSSVEQFIPWQARPETHFTYGVLGGIGYRWR
jgi:hypothetical protein